MQYIGTFNKPGGGTVTAPSANYYALVLNLSGSNGTTNYAIQAGLNQPGSGTVDQLVLDNSGNLYATGGMYDENSNTASGTTDKFIGGDGGTITISGSSTAFGKGLYVLKATASTGALAWVSQVDTKSGDINGSSIAVDNNTGNVFMTGQYGSVQLGTGSGTIELATTGGNYGAFLAEMNSSGAFQWAKGIQGGAVAQGGTNYYAGDYIGGVAVDSSGNPIVTGTFTDGALLNPGSSTQQTLPHTISKLYPSSPSSYLQSATRAFVEKFNSSGTSQWIATEAGAAGSNFANDAADHIVVDGSGNIVTTGTLLNNTGGTSIFGSTTIASPGTVSNAFMWTLSDGTSSTTTQFAGVFGSGKSDSDGSLSIGRGLNGVFVGINTAGTTDIDPRSSTTVNVSVSSGGGVITDSITDQGAPSCFAAGTRITTARGEVAVEDLREGDLILGAVSGQPVPVTWIGFRHLDCARHADPAKVWPIRVHAGAFGANVPCRDLLLSPNHAVHTDGVLIPVGLLVNGGSIEQVPMDTVTYYHVELPEHDVLLADGLPAESYLDIGDRADFSNGGGALTLHPDFANRARDVASIWETKACAPLVLHGYVLETVRRRLAAAVARAA